MKINWLLILQGWAMLWVVIGHAGMGQPGEGPQWENVLFTFAYSFHMPLFILISGWLFHLTRLSVNTPGRGGQIWSYGEIVKDKVVRLLLPGFVFSIVAFILKLAFPAEMTRKVSISIQDIVHQFLYPNDNPMRELWFIATLFWFFLMTPFWKWVLEKNWLMWVTLGGLVALHFIYPDTELLCMGRAFKFAIWFYIGLVMSKKSIVEKVMSRSHWLTLTIGIIIYAVGCYTNPFIITIGGVVLSFGLALIANHYWSKTFFTFRNYTYQIFLMGIFAQIFIKIAYKYTGMPYWMGYIICVLVGLYIPVLISKMIEKISWTPLSLCVGLKSKLNYKKNE